MPCYTPDDRDYRHNNEVDELEETIAKFEAVLCGIMKVDPKIVDRINWADVGITKQQHMNWWKQHQKEDAWVKKLDAMWKRETAKKNKAAKKKAVKKVAKKKGKK